MIRLIDASKRYAIGNREMSALDRVNLHVGRGEFVAIVGPSGSGKSTLLNVLGCLDVPDSGKYFFDGADISAASDAALARLRCARIGFVFQSFHLIDRLTARQNVEQPMLYRGGISRQQRRNRALALLASVGLEERCEHRPTQLSGGQQQRVAVARALANSPEVIIADEPTGNLDSATTQEILDLLEQQHRAGTTLILVTHDDDIASRAGRVLHMRDGIMREREG